MELRPAERLILAMLSDIYDHLKLKEIDTKLLRGAIYDGHGWALDWDMSGIAKVDEVDEAVVSEVVDVLDMYDMLELAADQLPAGALAHLPAWKLKFHGFDGNGETTHMGVARFLVETMGRWQRFKGRDFNSHVAVMPGARAMLGVFEPLREKLGDRTLTAAEIEAIASAA